MSRRFELDWLHFILFAILVWHHAAVGFADFGADIYGFSNDDLAGPGLSLAIYFSHCWRLPALFLIAGVGAWFATRRVGGDLAAGVGFLAGRAARLLAPAIFGTFVLNLAAVLLIEAIFATGAEPWETVAGWWATPAPEQEQAMHLWFLVNLAAYTALAAPLYVMRGRLAALPLSAPALLCGMAAMATIYLAAAKPHSPAIAGDGHQWAWYLGFFVGGYLMGAKIEPALDWLRRRVFLLIGAGVLLFSAEVAMLVAALERSPQLGAALASGGWAAAGAAPAYAPEAVAFAIVEGLNAWAWSLAAFGLAARYLAWPSPILPALSQSVFAIYVLHFPLTLIGLAVLAQISWPWPLELVVLALGVYAATAALYQVARRLGPLAYLIGGRPKPRVGRAETAPR